MLHAPPCLVGAEADGEHVSREMRRLKAKSGSEGEVIRTG